MNPNQPDSPPIALITGAARRIGAATACMLHKNGYNIAIHYRKTATQATELVNKLNRIRPESAITIQADLLNTEQTQMLIESTVQQWGHLNVLINNASSFYPTPIGEITGSDWDDLLGTNLKAPLFLSQAAAPHLQNTQGCIINIVDIHAERPMLNHTVYSIAKAGLAALTKSLARELAPAVRVNAVAPGAILWPEQAITEPSKAAILEKIALQRNGEPNDIAQTIKFLAMEAPYITGQIIPVDGGRNLYI